MSRIYVSGMGAVSPAGWGVAALREALARGEPLPVQTLARPGWEKPLPVRPVPPPTPRPEFLAHPRLRRASPITHYTAAAALEAGSRWRGDAGGSRPRMGIIVSLQSGCVQYSCRFYDETLKDPATASPLVFPETVYAAPASHVAALWENVVLGCSLVGDASAFLQAVALGAQWLEDDRVDACLVIGAEETNWIMADAVRYLDRSAVVTAGAGALCLCRDPKFSAGVELTAITDAHTFSTRCTRAQAAAAMRAQLGAGLPGELLCDGIGHGRADAAEQGAWRDWTGLRLSPKKVLGEGLMAAAAWQCVAACDAVAKKSSPEASVSLVGANQQALGARFTGGISHLSPVAAAGNIPS